MTETDSAGPKQLNSETFLASHLPSGCSDAPIFTLFLAWKALVVGTQILEKLHCYLLSRYAST